MRGNEHRANKRARTEPLGGTELPEDDREKLGDTLLDGVHPYGVKPQGNLLQEGADGRSGANLLDSSLGSLRRLSSASLPGSAKCVAPRRRFCHRECRNHMGSKTFSTTEKPGRAIPYSHLTRPRGTREVPTSVHAIIVVPLRSTFVSVCGVTFPRICSAAAGPPSALRPALARWPDGYNSLPSLPHR